jgi:D-alanyl-D-alanine carboxypeptidase/D-alanyl-D-alanine-endopeptidase (penicillin-binding protein 4)
MKQNLRRALALVALCAASAAAQPTLDQRMQQVMERPEFVHAIWGMEFYDLGAKRTVFSVNRDRLFVPGSTTKLLTTGTALELLGRDHRFHTRVYRTGPVNRGTLAGDLVLVAGGDPNLSGRLNADGTLAFTNVDHSYGGLPLDADPLAVLRGIARQVAGQGIQRITGRVIVDVSLFPEGDRELGTRVTLSPMVLNDNVIDVVVTPGAKAGESASVRVLPDIGYLSVTNQLVTADSGTAPRIEAAQDSTNPDRRVLRLTGRVPVGAAPQNVRWAVASPSRFGEIAFAAVLIDAGVQASARPASDAVDFKQLAARYADTTLVTEHRSAPFSEEAKVILKMSQNLHASLMPAIVAVSLAPGDTSRTGFDLEREFLVKGGLDVNGAVQGDGAGGDAFFSPAFMTRYLEYCATRPWADVFRSSLPILGKDGTLAAIQPQSVAAGQVFAKTGTYASYDPLHRRLLVHAKGLAGYFTSKSGRQIAFAIYVNNFALDKGDPAAFAGQTLGEIAALGWELIP